MSRYYIRGKGQVDLTQREFIAKGGEGSIYGKGNIIYKIYEDLSLMIPEAKIDELQILTNPLILKPREIVLDRRKRVVGFTMDWIKNTIDLCKLFTNGFRERNNFSDPTQLIENIREIISEIHKCNCLIVDGNEFNYLADSMNFSTPYFIDVNSYQTPSFPATAIMPSIRDYSCGNNFSEYSDWFSFAIICCQLFVGIHPFKGRHPAFKKNDLQGRMKANVSIFNKDIEIPPMTRDLNLIPTNYKDWFISLFDKSNRELPPSLVGKVIVVPFKILPTKKSTDNFIIDLIKEFDSEVLFYGVKNGIVVVKTKEKIYLNYKEEYSVTSDVEVVFTPAWLTPVLVKIEDQRLKFKSLGDEIGKLDIECTDKMIVENTLYIRNEGKLIEIALDNINKRVVPSVKSTSWDIMPYSSEIFSNVIYQNIMGNPYLGIPIPKIGELSSFIEIKIPELEGYKIIDAKYENHVCMVVSHKLGQYDRFILRFDKNFRSYDCRVIEDIDYTAINFVVLDNGIVVSMNEDDRMEIFSNNIKNKEVSTIADPDINSTLRLCKNGVKLMFFQDNKLYRIQMK